MSLWQPTRLGAKLTAWYDASVSSTVTRDGSNLVSQWNDRSGNGRHATQGTAAAKPTYNAATGRFSFDGTSDYLDLPASIDLGSVSRCVAAVVNINPSETNNQCIVGPNGVDAFAYFGRATSDRCGITKANVNFFGQGPVVSTNADHIFLGSMDATTWRSSLDGTAVTGTHSYTFTSRTGFIGKEVLGSTSYDWLWGTLGEVVIASSLTLGEQQQLEGYLAWKWNLVANLPANHPYKTAAPEIYESVAADAFVIEIPATWTPYRLVPRLAAWYDASDGGTIVQASSKISQWGDKSGNQRAMLQATSALQPAVLPAELNGLNAASFSSAYMTSVLAGSISGPKITVMAVVKPGSTWTQYSRLWSGATATGNDYSSTAGMNFQRVSNQSSMSATFSSTNYAATAVTLDSWSLMGMVVNSTAASVHINGGTTSATTPALNLAITRMALGTNVDGLTERWNNPIAEVVICSDALSTSDRQKVEGYLAWKWGLTANLPSDHPYKTVAPDYAETREISADAVVSYIGSGSSVRPIVSGGTVTTNGNVRSHTFTQNGTLTVTGAGTLNVLVVAGGGGGHRWGGGGGAGGVITQINYPVTAGTYAVTVGTGGGAGASGGNSAFGILAAAGGGYGGRGSPFGSSDPSSGGSGGGGAANTTLGAAGTAGQGYKGGDGDGYGGGGGGGATGAGQNALGGVGGNGGPGIVTDITGTSLGYAGGGGGGSYNTNGGSTTQGGGQGSPGGGDGAAATRPGAGGGGSGYQLTGGAGADGIVIVSYTLPQSEVSATAYLVDATWTPLDFAPGVIKTWLDAGIPTSVVANGGLVSQWIDQSGNGNHASQATGSAQPTYASNAIVFDGSSDFLDLPGIGMSTPNLCIAAVVRVDYITNGNNMLLGPNGTGGVTLGLTANDVRLFKAGGSSLAGNDVPFWRGEYRVVVVNLTATTQRRSMNGYAVENSWSGQTFDSARTAVIGKEIYGGTSYNYLGGSIRELIVTTALSSADQVRMEGYLANKWGIGDGLTTDHLWRERKPIKGTVGTRDLAATGIVKGNERVVVADGFVQNNRRMYHPRRIYISGFESGTLADQTLSSGTLGTTVQVQSSVVRTGNWALQFSPASNAAAATSYGILNDAVSTTYKTYLRWYINITTAPTSDRIIAIYNGTTPATFRPAIRYNAAAKTLSIVSSQTAAYATSSTAIQANRWYCVELGLNLNANLAKLRIDGIDETGWVAVGDVTSYLNCCIGPSQTSGGAMTIAFDDIAVDCHDWCGPGKVVRATIGEPFTATENLASWSPTNAATNAAAIDKTTVDDTSYAVSSTTQFSEMLFKFGIPQDTVNVSGVALRFRARYATATSSVTGRMRYNATYNRATTTLSIASNSFGWFNANWYSQSRNHDVMGGHFTPQSFTDYGWGLMTQVTGQTWVSYMFLEVDIDDSPTAVPGTYRVWMDDFENGALSASGTYGYYSLGGNDQTVSQNRAWSGKYAVRISPGIGVEANTNRTSFLITDTLNSSSRRMYGKGMVYIESVNPVDDTYTSLLGAANTGYDNRGAWIYLHSDRSLSIRDESGLGSTSTLALTRTAPNTVPLGEWFRLEFYFRSSLNSDLASNGIMTVRVNGTDVISTQSLSTYVGTSFSLAVGRNAIREAGWDIYVDDIAADSQRWIGNHRIESLVPTGTGNTTSEWFYTQKNGRLPHWAQLDEAPADDDGTWVNVNLLSGAAETYAKKSLGYSDEWYVSGAQVFLRSKYQNSYVSLSLGLWPSYLPTSTDAFYSGYPIQTSYQSVPAVMRAHDYDGSMSPSSIDSMEMLLKRDTASKNYSVQATQLRIMVDLFSYLNNRSTDLTASFIVQQQRLSNLATTSIVAATVSAQLSAWASVLDGTAVDVQADGWIPDHSVTADAMVIQQIELVLNASAIVLGIVQVEATAVVIQATTKNVTANAFVYSDSYDVNGSGIVREANLAAQITGDGMVITPGLVTFTANGVVVTSVLKTLDLGADAVILSPGEISADSVITAEQGSGRYVQFTAGTVGADMRLTLGERTEGTVLVSPSQTIGNQFVAGFSAKAVALAIWVDSRTETAGSPITVELVSSGGVVLGSAVLNDSARGISPSTGYVGWYFLKLPNQISLAYGSTYVIRATAESTAPKVVATTNAFGAGGVQGAVLNSFVVTDQPGTQFDSRPLIIAPLYDGEATMPRRSYTLASRTVDSIWISEGCDVSLAPSSAVELTVNKLLYLNHHASLESVPAANALHRIRFSAGGGLVVDGTLELTGHAKTRHATVALAMVQGGKSMTLESAPTGWRVNDVLSIPSYGGTFMTCRIASLSGTSVTLASGVTAGVQAGRQVVNLSRATGLEGNSASARAKFWMRRGSTTRIANAELNKVGQGCTIAPETNTVCELDDVVIWDISFPTDSTAPSAVTAGPGVTARDLTIARAKWGVIASSDWTHEGTLILHTIYNENSGLVISNGLVQADILADNVLGHPVLLTGEGSFHGRIDNPNAKFSTGSGGLVRVTNGVNGSCRISGTVDTTNLVRENLAVVSFDEGTLSELLIQDMVVACPWLLVANGTGGTMKGLARRCLTTAEHRIVGFDEVERLFTGHFVDDWGEGDIFDDWITGIDGFTAAVRTRSEAWNGRHEQDTTDAIVTEGSWRLTATEGTYTAQIILVPLLENETLRLGFWAKGDITVELGGLVSTVVSSENWVERMLVHTATEDTVIRVLASTDSVGWLDGVERR